MCELLVRITEHWYSQVSCGNWFFLILSFFTFENFYRTFSDSQHNFRVLFEMFSGFVVNIGMLNIYNKAELQLFPMFFFGRFPVFQEFSEVFGGFRENVPPIALLWNWWSHFVWRNAIMMSRFWWRHYQSWRHNRIPSDKMASPIWQQCYSNGRIFKASP
jgi:hypothetical protein